MTYKKWKFSALHFNSPLLFWPLNFRLVWVRMTFCYHRHERVKKNQFSRIEPNCPIFEVLNPVATYMSTHINVFNERKSNVIVFNREIHEDPCGCIILRNLVHWMRQLKKCFCDVFFEWFPSQKKQVVSKNEIFENKNKSFFKFYFTFNDYSNSCSITEACSFTAVLLNPHSGYVRIDA